MSKYAGVEVLISLAKQSDLTIHRLYYGPANEYLIWNFMAAQNVGKLVWKALVIASYNAVCKALMKQCGFFKRLDIDSPLSAHNAILWTRSMKLNVALRLYWCNGSLCRRAGRRLRGQNWAQRTDFNPVGHKSPSPHWLSSCGSSLCSVQETNSQNHPRKTNTSV